MIEPKEYAEKAGLLHLTWEAKEYLQNLAKGHMTNLEFFGEAVNLIVHQDSYCEEHLVSMLKTQDKSWTNCIAYWIWKHAAHTVMAKSTFEQVKCQWVKILKQRRPTSKAMVANLRVYLGD